MEDVVKQFNLVVEREYEYCMLVTQHIKDMAIAPNIQEHYWYDTQINLVY